MSNDFNVAVPQDELDAKPDFAPLPAGWYTSTLQTGAEAVSNNSGWAGIRVPFAGFTSKADGKEYPNRKRNYQITTESNSAQAVQIGAKQRVELAVAFGLAEDTVDAAGKPAKKLTAESAEEFVSQLNSVGGSPCDVYLTVKPRKNKGVVVMKDDGTGPVMDNEISRVAPLGQGK